MSTKSYRLFIIPTLVVLMWVGIFGSAAWMIFRPWEDYWVVARLDAGGGVYLVVSMETFCDPSPCNVVYEVEVNGAVTVPKATFDHSGEDRAAYTLIGSPDKKLVGIARVSAPKGILAIFDMRTGETWPRQGEWQFEEETPLIARFRSAYPEMSLWFSGERKSRVP